LEIKIWRQNYQGEIPLNDPTKQDDEPSLPYGPLLAAMKRLAAEYRAKQNGAGSDCSVRDLSFARQLGPADLLEKRIADRGHDAVG
jgi:hypothetical protein